MEDYQSILKYNENISPSKLFKNKEEVIKFVHISSSLEDLKCFLNRCEEEELYEYCTIIRNKISEKIYNHG